MGLEAGLDLGVDVGLVQLRPGGLWAGSARLLGMIEPREA